MTASPVVRRLTIDVPRRQVDDLQARLRATRCPDLPAGSGWEAGADPAWMQHFCRYWCEEYNWYEHQELLNRLGQYVIHLHGDDVHFQHHRSTHPDAIPLILTHGWPSCFFEMSRILAPLADPPNHRERRRQAFHVIVPSLPGFGYSSASNRPHDPLHVAQRWIQLMDALGYERFAAHGGDFGAAVTGAIAALVPERVIGIHLTAAGAAEPDRSLTAEELAWHSAFCDWRDREWGYLHLQRTKPNTPAFALNDSPAGLAAWLLEKWWSWCDLGTNRLEDTVPIDTLATLVSIYWFTGTIGTSMWMYRHSFGAAQPPPVWYPSGFRLDVPAGITAYREPIVPPQSLLWPHFDLRHYQKMDSGGHFPAIEQPESLIDQIQTFFGELRRDGRP